MTRTLTPEEASVHKTFSTKLTLEDVDNMQGIGMLMGKIRYSVENPVAYRIKGTDSTLVFGELKNPIDIDQLRRMYEEKFKSREDGEEATGLYSKIEDRSPEEPEEKNGVADRETEDDEVRDERLLEEDISVISSQVGASRKEIIRALAESNYDVVDAMMKLTK